MIPLRASQESPARRGLRRSQEPPAPAGHRGSPEKAPTPRGLRTTKEITLLAPQETTIQETS
ncbi:hypothetical protein HTZ77_01295 [Nonomuraea sp. SMC257]|uniref:Uncharacterized protein n=1 Tax=Nonomuraea montanisoli TaxID=2741721 RepID=A0A7Y6I3H8_9ACTN|nr:hypothetical protein [Nonomuraea montanisoli]NUW30070.1 hypothetical protein [Nonomuraea montanisoli]